MNLGIVSTSKTTVSVGSRAQQEAGYEPAGPPRMTSTDAWVGMDISMIPMY